MIFDVFVEKLKSNQEYCKTYMFLIFTKMIIFVKMIMISIDGVPSKGKMAEQLKRSYIGELQKKFEVAYK